MKMTSWCFAALAPIAAVGCSGTIVGHLAVLALTIGLFIGTLSLGKPSTTSVAAGTDVVSVAVTSEVEKG